MKSFRSEAGSQTILGIGLLALNTAMLLVVVGSSSLLIQQRALTAVSDATALDLADWLRVNRDNPDIHPSEWNVTVQTELRRLARGTTVGQLGSYRLAGLELQDDRLVSLRLCADSWLALGPSVQVCAQSAATEN